VSQGEEYSEYFLFKDFCLNIAKLSTFESNLFNRIFSIHRTLIYS